LFDEGSIVYTGLSQNPEGDYVFDGISLRKLMSQFTLFENVIKEIESIVKDKPENESIKTWENIAKFLYEHGYHYHAIDIWKKLITYPSVSDKNHLKYIQKVARSYYLMDFYEEAAENYEKALRLAIELDEKENQMTCTHGLAMTHEHLKPHQNAIKYYQNAIKLAVELDNTKRKLELENMMKKYMNIITNSADMLCDIGQYEQALLLYDAILEAEPKNLTVLNNKGLTLHNMKKYPEAIECYDLVLATSLNDVDATFGKIEALSNMGNYDKAISSLTESIFNVEKCIELEPQNYEFWNNKGVLLTWLGRLCLKIENDVDAVKWFEDAVKCYNKAIEFYPDSITILQNKLSALKYLDRGLDYRNCSNRINIIKQTRSDEKHTSLEKQILRVSNDPL